MSQVLSQTALEAMSVSDLLDLPWDAIEAAKGFQLPPEGAYFCDVLKGEIGSVGKENNKQESISLEFSIYQVAELLTATDTPPEAGTKFDINYIGGKGAGYFKRDFGQVAQGLGVANLREFLAKLGGCKVMLVLTHRASGTSKFPQISDVTLVG